jgi:DNA-binding Lrp family transcriptional regulator
MSAYLTFVVNMSALWKEIDDKIREKSLKNIQQTREQKKSLRESNASQILEIVVSGEPKGISTAEIEEKTGLSHETVTNHCKELVRRTIIVKKNKKAKYHLTDAAYNLKEVRAQEFKRNSIECVRRIENPFEKENVFSNITVDFYTKENYDKLRLFSFVNWLGALLAYAMIEAVRPGARTAKIREKHLGPYVSGQNKDSLALDWIRNVIDPVELFKEFLELPLVKRGLPVNNPRFWNYRKIVRNLRPDLRKRLKQDTALSRKLRGEIANHNKGMKELRKFEPESFNRSRFELDMVNFKKLVNVFAEIYPIQFSKLEDVRSKMDEITVEFF